MSMAVKTSGENIGGNFAPKTSQRLLQAARSSVRKVMCNDVLRENAGREDQPGHSQNSQEAGTQQTTRRVHFDFVGSGTDPRTRNEMFALTHELLENCKNCCLQRFCSKRHCPCCFLHQLLVRNVDRRLQMMQCKLTGVQLQYYDLRQHPITGHFFHLLRSDISFSTTQQLYRWLDSQYRRLFGVGQWHEVIEVKYEFEDPRYVIHRVTLVIMNLYLHKLDANSKRSMCRLLRTPTPPLKRPMRRGIADERSMLINDCISAHFGGGEPWWIIFDVSLDGGQIAGDMLKMAHCAYTGMKEAHRKLTSADNDWTEAPEDRLKGGGVQNSPLSAKQSAQTRSVIQRKLYTWTERFEKCFEKIYKALKQYYDCKYAEGVAQLCQNVCQKSKHADREDFEGDEKQPQSSMQYYFNRYKLAQVSLENLLRELEFCEYKNNLVPYLRRKAKELNENAAKYKVQKLKMCKSQLADAIKDEILAVRNN